MDVMAMIISKFHRMIQSRLLWAAFLVIIVFSFVIWGTQLPDRGGGAGSDSPGRLDGKPVDPREFRLAWQNEYVRMALMFGRVPPVDRELDQYLTDRAWRRLVALREARRLGVRVEDAEVASFVKRLPAFQTNGRFDLQRYKAFVQRSLGAMGYSERFIEEHIREELVLAKLRSLIASTALVTPADVDAAIERLTDVLTVEYVAIPRASVEKAAEPTDEEVRAFFEANPERYQWPPAVEVQAVFFPMDAHLDEVPPIPEQELEDYYERHVAEFRDVASAGEGDGGETQTTVAPFEKVRAEIEQRLRRQAAMQRAAERADAFWRRIMAFVTDRPPSFEEAARQFQVELQSIGPFYESEPVAGFRPGSDFHRAAFSLRDDPDEKVSLPIESENGYYILSLVRRLPPRQPAFEDVADRVRRDAQEKKLAEVLDKRGEQVAAAARAGVSLRELAESSGLTYESLPPFSLQQNRPELPEAEALIRAALNAEIGAVLGPFRTGMERALVARLVDRKPAEPADIAPMRGLFTEMLRQQRADALYEAWLSHLLKQAKFEPAQRPQMADDSES